MAKKKEIVTVALVCGKCKRRNYSIKKNKKRSPGKIEVKKYCRSCREHILHKETK
ncbi:50S ribosomal protein L33 [bacterium]|nr:50S ribosomal protein L33 [bacterium]